MVHARPVLAAALAFASVAGARAQPPSASPEATLESLQAQLLSMQRQQQGSQHSFQQIRKDIDDLRWIERTADIASFEKVRITSKPARVSNPTAQGAGNPLIMPVYVFTPLSLKAGQRAPLVIAVHEGIHGNFDTLQNLSTVRELIAEGYVVVAPEYRGSTGYGSFFYDQIDYGGTEIDDTYAARNWAVENLPVNPAKVGIMGFSHGGYHTLLNILRWPKAYQVAYAGVPVSDLVSRMGYKNQRYRDIFKEFIGKEAVDDVAAYRDRSPWAHAAKLETPLLIHTTTNDEDVNVLEVERLIDALKAAGKKFEYKIYDSAPGGHYFNRIDTPLAVQSRKEILAFLGRYLKP